LVLGGVVLAAVVWSALGGPGLDTIAPPPEPPPIPTPNGYDDVVEAGREIEKSGLTGPKFDLEKSDAAALKPVVEGTREAVALGRKGLGTPFQVPVVYDLKAMMTGLMSDLAVIRGGLVRALRAEGRLAALEGRMDEAAACGADIVRLGAKMSHGVPMLPYLVSVAIGTTGLRDERDLRGKLTPEQCRQIIALLEEIEGSQEDPANVVGRETWFLNQNVKKLGFVGRISMKVSGMHAKNLKQIASSLASAENREAASRRLVLADLALRVYRNEHGEDPPDLNSLVPGILKAIPLDPYTGKPLLYVRTGKDGTVYSAGPDRDDDKLARPLPFRHNDMADGDFTIDSF
jgi:hypothetical protein